MYLLGRKVCASLRLERKDLQNEGWHGLCFGRTSVLLASKGVALKTIKNLISLAVFAVGAFKAVCIVDGCVYLKSAGLRLEMRIADKELPVNQPIEKPLPPYSAVVTPKGSY